MAEPDNTHAPVNLARLWQLPVLLLSVVMLLVGWILASDKPEQPVIYPQLIDKAAALIAAGQYENALDRLDEVKPALETLRPELRGRYHLLRGDAYALSASTKGADTKQVHEAVVGLYEQAMKFGLSLDKPHLVRYTDSLVALGHFERARAQLPALGAAGSAARQRLWRKMIEAAGRNTRASPAQRLALIQDFLEEPSISREDMIWATARQAEIILNETGANDAIRLLLRRVALLRDGGVADLGELMVLLGRAYLDIGAEESAEQWFTQALDQLPEQDPLRGEALVGLGRIRLAEGNVTTALEHFDDAATHYPMTRCHVRALVGRAESQARLSALDQALEDYGKAVKLAAVSPHVSRSDRQLLVESLESQRDWRFAQGDYDIALRLLELQEELFGQPTPAPLLARLASTHEQLALDILGATDEVEDITPLWTNLAPEQRGQISVHFEKAGDYYLAHAEAVTLSDDDSYGESLWRAGDCYDKAGLHNKAIGLFRRFITERPSDPRKLMVIHRLGQAYQADSQLDAAISQYETLINEHPKTPEAYQSLVPLARCYVNKGPDFRAKAEHILTTVVNDHPAIRPESNEYRKALIELGTLYYMRGEEGDYERAIERLSAAVDRYGDQPNLPDMLFRLGDAYRKSVGEIDVKLEQPLPPSRRVAFEAERTRRLERARECFDRAISLYNARDPKSLGQLQKLFLRNAYFYRADCAYDLGRYQGPDGAIALYEQTVKRYENDPSVLVALVQIVNCWCELGNYDEARSVNNRAKWFLKRIPDEQLDDPDLPMSREHWQRWLEWMSELNAKADQETAAVPTP